VFGGRFEAFFTVPSATTVAATNSGGTATSVSLTAGSYTPTSYCAHLAARLNAVRTPATWTVSLSTGQSGTGLVTIDCVGETWALTFTTAAAGTVIGFTGNIGSTTDPSTGTQNARGLWMPDCPFMVELDPKMAPKVTDSRGTEGPTGIITTYKGTSKYVHKQIRFSHVTQARAIKHAETTTYASLQSWLDDTQYHDGHTWFSVGSRFQLYADYNGTDTIVGYELNTNTGPTYGWGFSPAISDFSDHVKRADAGYLGMWSVDFPRIVSRG